MLAIKAEYLGASDNGVKVHSKFLANCDALSTFDKFKSKAISKEHAPFFIDLVDVEGIETLETIGVDEKTYSDITGETVMTYEYYQREADFNQDLVFGAIEQGLREKGVDMPWPETESFGLAALKLKKFRQSDHVIHEISVDDLEV
ncbi:hypothetical protein [Pseudoalteromonas luteoviolacea]|uniref:hypothetical protein n=1 Tax=Pseudoalteromonas luteoviolacea TaxID=43657 RepID=UPI001B36C42C|nr:hypothetical protein [Pseudoalteromonas luteoviolacea]MBQ4839796.1 hypothetical protein [Pseudoalteromonas luteoviolacea]